MTLDARLIEREARKIRHASEGVKDLLGFDRARLTADDIMHDFHRPTRLDVRELRARYDLDTLFAEIERDGIADVLIFGR